MYKHPNLRIGYVSQHATHHIGMCTVPLLRNQDPLPVTPERHLEKTPIQYIQWRFQDGHDRTFIPVSMLCRCLTDVSITGEVLEKVTRVLTDAEKAQMEVEFVGKNGQRRKLEVCRAHCSRNVVSHNDPRS